MAIHGVDEMVRIVGVKLCDGKIYEFDAGDKEFKLGDNVLVETEKGQFLGKVAVEPREKEKQSLLKIPPPILRKATDEDLKQEEMNLEMQREAFVFCLQRIRERELPMKLVRVEFLFDRSKAIFYFTAESRVDFRELVKNLVQKFRTRIELRQIGIRNGTRILGGIGTCGREICCARFLHNFDRVSIKMAKEQNMSLNPEKISGLCGRLMCCLAFEYETYLDIKKHVPKCGKKIVTSEGQGKVIRQNIFQGKISVELEDGKEIDIDIKDITAQPQSHKDTKCRK